MKLQEVNHNDCMRTRLWRNSSMPSLRTPYMLTEDMQEEFFRDVINNRNSQHRYYAVYDGSRHVATCGLTYIQWENRIAEISLRVAPKEEGNGIGERAIRLLLREGFGRLNLQTVCGECYMCNPAVGFWRTMVERFNGYMVNLPKRKFWDGQYYDGLYFSFDRKVYSSL